MNCSNVIFIITKIKGVFGNDQFCHFWILAVCQTTISTKPFLDFHVSRYCFYLTHFNFRKHHFLLSKTPFYKTGFRFSVFGFLPKTKHLGFQFLGMGPKPNISVFGIWGGGPINRKIRFLVFA